MPDRCVAWDASSVVALTSQERIGGRDAFLTPDQRGVRARSARQDSLAFVRSIGSAQRGADLGGLLGQTPRSSIWREPCQIIGSTTMAMGAWPRNIGAGKTTGVR